MARTFTIFCFIAGVIGCGGLLLGSDAKDQYMKWKVHDKDRPHPQVVDPGFAGAGPFTGKAPSDAVVLFDGSSADAFRTYEGKPISWDVVDGCLVVKPGAGDVWTKQSFGDIQLHVEYMIPGRGDDRSQANNGNSGLYIMDRYEVQVINNKMPGIYADGMAGAIYGQFPPMVNADRGLNKWQSYDIIFNRPHFDNAGNLIKPAAVTIFQNGVLVQNHQEIMGPTVYGQRTSYSMHGDALPIKIQNHADPVHYRNIWVRDISDGDEG